MSDFTSDGRPYERSLGAEMAINVLAGGTKPVAMAPVDCIKTNVQLGKAIMPQMKKDGPVKFMYRGVSSLSIQFSVYYGGILGLKSMLKDRELTAAETSMLTIGQTLWGVGLMMHLEHEKINNQAGNQAGKSQGFPVRNIYNAYAQGEGKKYRYGTPALFLRELLFMIPINVKGHAEEGMKEVFRERGLVSEKEQFIAKWTGAFGIFFVSGAFTNIPDSMNSHLKNNKAKIHKIGPLIKSYVDERGVAGTLKYFSKGWQYRGLTIAISACSTFAFVELYQYLHKEFVY
eukprot:m.335826 g.335826  ORF g.335826 m.335826 type:complete len:288 (-) comp17686_c0_seq1:235-1098(-)